MNTYNKIIKAIDEGLQKSLINFGNDRILKTSKVDNMDLLKFEFGDIVYYDKKIGYNNIKLGKKIALCINDEPNKELYIMIEHNLYHDESYWATPNTKLVYSKIPYSLNGYENTYYILSNFCNELDESIWAQLKPNEYIPSITELKYIYSLIDSNANIFEDNGIPIEPIEYWSSNSDRNEANEAKAMDFGVNETTYCTQKTNPMCAIVLLHIKK